MHQHDHIAPAPVLFVGDIQHRCPNHLDWKSVSMERAVPETVTAAAADHPATAPQRQQNGFVQNSCQSEASTAGFRAAP